MRLLGRWRARLLRSPAYLLLSAPLNGSADGGAAVSSAVAGTNLQRRFPGKRQQQRLFALPGGGTDGDGIGGPGARAWLWLAKRRLTAACRPRILAKLFGATLVAFLLVIIITKGYSMRRRATCKCAKFTYSQCQPYDGICGQGVKKAFCQQKRCMPRRKMVRCLASCDKTDGPSDGLTRVRSACTYMARRQSLWTRCSEGTQHRSRILFLQAGPRSTCPPTKTERRSCNAAKPVPPKSCSYEPRGTWTVCNRERNEIVNTRRLSDGGASGDCPMEHRTAMRCLKRDGTLRCIYSKWTKWSQCFQGRRHRVRVLIQGDGCGEVTRLVQNCSPRQGLADTDVVRK